jgi:tripartite-type tricarboxylate transporter receptor subunit TctC
MMAGVNLVHAPYRGAGPALVDLLGGQVQVMFASMSTSIEYVRARKLQALAVTTASDGNPIGPTLNLFGRPEHPSATETVDCTRHESD